MDRTRLALFVSAALATSAAMAQLAQPLNQTPEGRVRWEHQPHLRHARAAHAVVCTGDSIYAIAGTGGEAGGPVLAVERFDGEAWTDETTLPGEGLNAPAAVWLDGRIYVVGGFGTTTNVPTDRVVTYEVARHAWGEATSLPSARGGSAAAAMDGKIHIIGGGNSRSTIADHAVYNPATRRWTERARLPRAEGSPAAVVCGGKLYAIGGRSGRSDFGSVYIYDEAKDAWSEGPAISPRATCGAVEYRGAIYLVGGEEQAGARVLGEVLTLAPGADAWQAGPPMPTPRSFARAVLFRDSIYVIGGSPTPQVDHAPEGSGVVERLQFEIR